MGAFYHKGQPYSGQMVVDTDLSAVSNNPVKNRTITGLVDDVIAPVEGANASQGYSAGEELIFNNLLYKAKSAITQDTPFDAGSSGNIELAGTIVDQLKALVDNEDKLNITQLSDANTNFTDKVLRLFTIAASSSTNTPTTSGTYWIFEYGTGQYRRQIAFQDAFGRIDVRYKQNTGAVWDQPWKRIYGYSPVALEWNVTPKSGSSAYIIKQGRVATLQAVCSFSSEVAANTILISANSAYAPQDGIAIPLNARSVGGTPYICDLIIGASGELKIPGTASVTIPANKQIQISGSWITAT